MTLIKYYLDLARLAYDAGSPQISQNLPPGFTIKHHVSSTRGGDGFQGITFESPSDTIVAFSGTQGFPVPHRDTLTQFVSGGKLALKIMPNTARSAYNYAQRALGSGARVSVVGHSLGGSLAQVVGTWLGVPFISFSGPGMARSVGWTGKTPQGASGQGRNVIGICFRISGDMVGKYGKHLGKEIKLEAKGDCSFFKHNLYDLERALDTDAYKEPGYFNPLFINPTVPAAPPMIPDFAFGPIDLSP